MVSPIALVETEMRDLAPEKRTGETETGDEVQ
jgi:hypothetical protein